MTTASRLSGIAPLAVFFDAIDTAAPFWESGVVQPSDGDYASFEYVWDFGDPGSGFWSTSGKSKNTAIGYTAMHVFENPGNYTITLQVRDASGLLHAYYQDVTVHAFTGVTYYVSIDRPA